MSNYDPDNWGLHYTNILPQINRVTNHPFSDSSCMYKTIVARNTESDISEEDFGLDQREAIRAAEELCYGTAVVQRLKKAKTTNELSRILATARERMYND